MKIKYLGTAAAEGIPALFCKCSACRNAALAGGKDVRLRSGALINDSILLDITPDIYCQKLRYDLDLLDLQAIVVTHSHTDHFAGAELTKRSSPDYCTVGPAAPLYVYGNEHVCETGRDSLRFEFHREEDASIQFRRVCGFQSFSIGDVAFTAIPASHDSREECLIYLIRHKGHAILYANDTGLLPEASLDAVSGIPLDLVSLDCTFGANSSCTPSHMGLPENLTLIQELKNRGCIAGHTRIVTTHFSHNCGANHEELCRHFEAYGILAAYDGMEIEC